MKFEKKIGGTSEIQVDNLEKAFKFVPKLDSDGVLSYNELKDQPKLPSGGIETIEGELLEIPTKLSQFTDDIGFLRASDGTATNLTVNGFTSNGEIKICGTSPHIDFYFNNATDDYTSRIIENSKGILTFTGGITLGSPLPVSSGGTGVTQLRTKWDIGIAQNDSKKDVATNISYSCQYYPYLKLCFVRIYFQVVSALTASTLTTVLTVPEGYRPSWVHALSSFSTAGTMSARVTSAGNIQVKCTGQITTSSDNYLSGFWYVG